MAEWTGRKRTLNSIVQEGHPPIGAASDHLPPPREAPGATNSPQRPGATPDTPDLIGMDRDDYGPLIFSRRPLTEYATAQRVLGLFTPPDGATLTAEDWEQGPSSSEEQRKANPALLTPKRPLGGYGLGIGRTAPQVALPAVEELGEIAAKTEVVSTIPATAQGLTAAPAANASRLETPAGAVHGTGTAECPPGYPVKGNAQSLIYHTTESRVYEQTIAEFCFETAEAAEAAGFRAPKN